jgi:ubiquitin-protein ligase E3 C
MTASGPWVSAYLQLQKIILTILDRQGADLDSQRYPFVEILTILLFLTDQIPSETSQSAEHFYRTLASVVSKLSSLIEASPENPQYTDAIKVSLETVITPLKRVTGYTLNAYEAFGYRIMSLPVVATESKPDGIHQVRHFLAESINYKLLANALATSFKDSGLYSHATLKDVAARFRLLGSFIYFHRHAHDFRSPEAYSAHRDFVAVVSVLLNSLPSNIVEGHVADSEDAEATETEAEAEVNGFLKEQILSLVNQEGIGNLLSGATTAEEASENEKIEEARHFANYALALLRFFPRRGDEIRMWLYMGPTPSQSPSWNLPAIRYFWKATKHSSVFATILRDSRAAIELLRPKADSSSTNLARGSFWQAPQQAVDRTAVRADEWRVIFVFLELYTFVSKVTDDEEFFSAAKDPFSNEVRDNALPLSEVKDLSTFLKNLGFTLYFNASDINGPEEPESSSTSLSFFSPRVEDTQPQRQASEPSVGGVPGLSLDYIKGLVTGLLRMLYERDSRRAFLPKEHWLMTSRFDMTAFIPSVVQEEESRHKIREQDAEDADEEDDYVIEGDQPIIGTRRTQHQRRWERIQRQQRKASRRRYLQAVAPRLEILQNMPFLIPFQTRVQIFREFIKLDMTKQRGDPDAFNFRMAMGLSGARHAAKIRREHEFEDAFEQFYPLGAALKEPIQITFIDQFQAVEAGIDGGGVTKEFLTSVTSRAFEPSDRIDMFVTNDQHLLYPNPSAIEELKAAMRQAGLSENSEEFRLQVKGLLQRYEFLGRIIGKCLYEGILVDVNFAPFFLRKWALTGGTGSAPRESGYRATLNDLRDLDEGLYQGLHQLKNYKGDVEDFALNFTVTDTIVVDHTTNPKKTRAVTRELKPNGSNIPVTNQNRLVYISFMARHRLQNQPYAQTMSFLKGLSSMIQPGWLSMFNHSELQTLLGGTSSSIDVEDLRRNTQYGGTYVIGDDGQEHPTIKLFWKVMKDMSDGERRAVLKFVTSTPRAPLLGFSTLNPNFSIRDSGSDQDRLPSTSTCVNLLKLPMYQNEMVLKEKLLYSVFSGAGFDLS